MKSFNFANECNGEVSKGPKSDFQSHFSTSKNIRIFLIAAHFLKTSIFKSLYFLKWCPIIHSSPLLQFSKFNNFIWLNLYLSLENCSTNIYYWFPYLLFQNNKLEVLGRLWNNHFQDSSITQWSQRRLWHSPKTGELY